MKLALVYDWVNSWGGAERVLLALHELWPEAPIYTSVYHPERASWAKKIKIIPSFLQKIPLFSNNHRLLAALTPMAFERFDFSNYEVVISITSAAAKSVVTSPKTLHLCYCLTPPRYLWSQRNEYKDKGILSMGAGIFGPSLRMQDYIAAQRVDSFAAISTTVSQRILKYYQKISTIIYPPVEILKASKEPNHPQLSEPYYLVVSRLVDYKRIDLTIQACQDLQRNLVIIGEGPEMKKWTSLTKGPWVKFLGRLTDDQLTTYYSFCEAVLFPGEEDFGIVPVEAQAYGKPVIAYASGGVTETVIDGKTGLFFKEKTVSSLKAAIESFEKSKDSFEPAICRANAERFKKERFKKEIEEWMQREFRKILSDNK